MKKPLNVVAAVCLALGGIFGLLGTLVPQRNLQASCWGIDGDALVVAIVLLALKFSRVARIFLAKQILPTSSPLPLLHTRSSSLPSAAGFGHC
jgi:hypothetical protein